MPTQKEHLHRLEVPVIVELGRRWMKLREVMNLLPGAIVDLDKDAGSELDLLVNNEIIASGTAVKVGENFGIRISSVGTLKQRSLGAGQSAEAEEMGDEDADALAAAFLMGQDT